ncbi:MAG TPA: TetR/AcrR family transcriptional regulator [Burkholderiales bacterium]|nr:TetR/AcrR family transcriptional regulator [Burkholderiales bacterium]
MAGVIDSGAVRTRTVKATVKDQPLIRERRDALIAAAVAVFKKKGFHASTVREIGRKAAMTQGTIYNYIRSKDDLLYLVCDRLVSQYQEETTKALAMHPDPVDRLRAAATAVAQVIYEHQDEILIIYQNTHLLDRQSLRIILHRVEEFVRGFEPLIRSAATHAEVRVPNTYLAANFLTFVPTILALRRWAFGAQVGRDEVLDTLTEFIVRGLGFEA